MTSRGYKVTSSVIEQAAMAPPPHVREALRMGERSLAIKEAVAAQAPLTRPLQVEKGAPLLKIESTSYLADGRPLEYYEVWHCGDRSKFEIEMVVSGPDVRSAR